MKKVTVKFKKPTKLEQRKPEHAQKFSGSREKKRVSPKSPILTALFLQKKNLNGFHFLSYFRNGCLRNIELQVKRKRSFTEKCILTISGKDLY